MKKPEDLRIKIFSDGAKKEDFIELGNLPYIKGFTTNPTLMKKAGVTDYEAFAKEILPFAGGKDISLEVIADDFPEMKRQALKLSALGENVYVKIPAMNTSGQSSAALVKELADEGVKVNVTAVLTLEQVAEFTKSLVNSKGAVVSVFAGRIADTGIDPIPVMIEAKEILSAAPNAELLWASPRELLNLYQAEEAGTDIITIQPDILRKFKLIGYDLHSYSLDTVKMFFNDATSSGFKL